MHLKSDTKPPHLKECTVTEWIQNWFYLIWNIGIKLDIFLPLFYKHNQDEHELERILDFDGIREDNLEWIRYKSGSLDVV